MNKKNDSSSKNFIFNQSLSSSKLKIFPYLNKNNSQLILKNKNDFSIFLKTSNLSNSKSIKKINTNNNKSKKINFNINNLTTISNPFRKKRQKTLKKLKLDIITKFNNNNNLTNNINYNNNFFLNKETSFFNSIKNNNNNDNNNNKINIKTEEYLNKEKKYINNFFKVSNTRKKILQLNNNNNNNNNNNSINNYKHKKYFKSLSPLNTKSKIELNKVILKIHFNQNNKLMQSTIIDLSKQKNKLNNFYKNIKNLMNKDYEKYYNIPLEDLV